MDPMAFPSFSYRQKLNSLKITKDFLTALEQYLLKWVVDAEIIPQDEAPKSLSIEIEDKHGTETMISISQLNSSRFPDSTSAINIVLRKPFMRDGMNFSVNISFSRGSRSSTLRIDSKMPNAREVVLGLKDGILRMLEQQKTWHWMAHPNLTVWFGLNATLVILSVALNSEIVTERYSFYLIGVIVSILIYWVGGVGVLRRYTVFDSRASERDDKIWGWLITGIGTFLVFGTLFTFFRRQLLGF